MRSVGWIIGVFIVGIGVVNVGCADILGLEPWEDKPAGSGAAGGEGADDTSSASTGAGSTSSGSVDPCANGVQDGAETGVDCGGNTCAPCPEAHGCVTDADCNTGYCPQSRGYCVMNDGRGACDMKDVDNPTCGDCVKNGLETDIDCGSECAPCRVGKVCLTDADCWSGVCSNGTCAAGAPNTRCFANTDCASNLCASGNASCNFDSCCR